MTTDIRTMIAIWFGKLAWEVGVRSGRVEVIGERELRERLRSGFPIAAIAGSLSGAFGADVVDALTVIKFPSLAAAGGVIASNAPAFIPTEGTASCNCSH